MRKRVIDPQAEALPDETSRWLDLEKIASVEVSSEDPQHPIESALTLTGGGGWRAAERGAQIIRLRFDEPQALRRIQVHFEEAALERNQEFTLAWAPTDEGQFREIVRQQYGFSPAGAVSELEDYQVELQTVRLLELKIVPDRSGGPARASLVSLRLA